jgi:2-hydroxy-6-oxonona-2,4-dienedioate hydrolase
MDKAKSASKDNARLVQRYTNINSYVMHSWCSSRTDPNRQSLVLLHGLVVSSAYMLPLARKLRHKYNLYAPDLPGHGKSSKPEAALSVGEMAQILHQWMTAMSVKQAVVVANSFGCQIAVKLAFNFPEAVTKLVLIGIPNHEENSFLVNFSKLLIDVAYEKSSIVPVVLQDFWKTSPLHSLETYRSMQADDILVNLRDLRIPTLLIRGENDILVPQTWMEEVASLIPNSTTATVAASGHATQFTQPEETARLVDEFLQSSAH